MRLRRVPNFEAKLTASQQTASRLCTHKKNFLQVCAGEHAHYPSFKSPGMISDCESYQLNWRVSPGASVTAEL